uniref:Uncharacterized protein n=1 Tax=Pristionchus pacificus TaxID=54126 RepID=A0A2A6BTT3_PRIPA|eukprot:PDM69305.1 hypothetical protein PRIPAC_47607 [Pristionchus pacificus]
MLPLPTSITYAFEATSTSNIHKVYQLISITQLAQLAKGGAFCSVEVIARQFGGNYLVLIVQWRRE